MQSSPKVSSLFSASSLPSSSIMYMFKGISAFIFTFMVGFSSPLPTSISISTALSFSAAASAPAAALITISCTLNPSCSPTSPTRVALTTRTTSLPSSFPNPPTPIVTDPCPELNPPVSACLLDPLSSRREGWAACGGGRKADWDEGAEDGAAGAEEAGGGWEEAEGRGAGGGEVGPRVPLAVGRVRSLRSCVTAPPSECWLPPRLSTL